MLDAHGEELSYVTCSLLCSRLPFLLDDAPSPSFPRPRQQPAAEQQQGPGARRTTAETDRAFGTPDHPDQQRRRSRDELVSASAVLALRRSHSFQPQHFTQCAAGLAAVAHREPLFWRDLARASSRRLATFSPRDLAVLCSAIAVSGFVPGLSWIQACDKQAGRIMHGMSPEELSALVWCWGAWNHTPTKRVVDFAKMRLRGMIKEHKLGPEQLLQVLRVCPDFVC